MIELHQYPPIWGLSSLSPFCIKVEDFLKRNQVPYKIIIESNPARGPKGKMPFIRDLTHGGNTVVADSTFIVNYLTETYYLHNEKLDTIRQAQGLAFQRMIEEHLYFVLLYSRWMDPVGWTVLKQEFTPLFPPLIGPLFLLFIRRQLIKQARAQGLGRHTQEEVYASGRRDLKAISSLLGDQRYLLGEHWSAVDSTLFAFLTTILKQPIESELKRTVLSLPNLVAYHARQDQEFSK